MRNKELVYDAILSEFVNRHFEPALEPKLAIVMVVIAAVLVRLVFDLQLVLDLSNLRLLLF